MGGAQKAKVTVRLPPTLMQVVGGAREVEVEGATVGEALGDLVRQRPELRVHLFDESGGLRLHVLCVCDGVYRGRGESLDAAVSAGAEIGILQAMSGG